MRRLLPHSCRPLISRQRQFQGSPGVNRQQLADARRHALLRFRFVAEALDPFDTGFAAKPCQLAFGVMAHVEFGLFDGALKRAQAARPGVSR